MNYYIVTEGRSGSTLLGHYLKQVGLGNPSAWLDEEMESLEAYRDCVHAKAVNGIISSKISWGTLSRIQKKIAEVDTLSFLTAVIASPAWIYLTRRNQVKQAVSRIKHDRLGAWHVYNDAELACYHKEDFGLLSESVPTPEIRQRMYQHALGNRAWELFFQSHGIHPLHIDFEDFLADKAGTLVEISAHLGKPVSGGDLHDSVRSTSTYINEKWYKTVLKGYSDLY